MVSRYKKIILAVLIGLMGQQSSALGIAPCLQSLCAPKNRALTAFVAAGIGIGLLSYIKNKYSQPTTLQKQVKAYYACKGSTKLITEPVEWPVKLVYDDNPFSWLLSLAGGYLGGRVTRYAGSVANSKDPAVVKAKIDHYQSFYKDVLNMNEFHVPAKGFKTFNHWFTRTFKDIERSRPMQANALHVASPADSKLLIIPNLSENTHVTIKEQRFDVAKFLGDKDLAKKFEGGVMMIFRLSPYDYHRYHYPFDCMVGSEQYINGAYHSVNPRAFNVGCKPLTENKRSYQILEPAGSSNAHCLNQVAMVQVGATAVASIKNGFMDYQKDALKSPNQVYAKGQETGYFQFGGSTVVLLFPANTIIPDAQIVQNSLNGYETGVKVRETIATWMTPRERLQVIGK